MSKDDGDALDPGQAGRLAIRGGALRASGYMAGLLLAAGSAPFLVRHLGLADFGRYVLITALISLVGGLTEAGVQTVGTREYSNRTGEERDRLMGNLLGIRLVLSLVGALVAVGFALLAGYDQTLVLGTAIAGAGLLVQSVQNLLVVPLVTQLRLGWTTVTELLRQGVTAALTLGLVVAGASLTPFFVVALAGAMASLVVTVVLVRGLTPFHPSFDLGEWWRLLRDVVVIAVAIAVNVTYFRIAIVIMSLLSTPLEVGYFGASYRIMEVMLPIPSLVVGGVFPILARAARDDRERLVYVAHRVFDVAVIAGVGLVLLLEIAAPLLVEVLAGEAGDPATGVLRIQAPALLATFLASGAGLTLFAMHRTREILVANLVALLLAASLASILIPPLGASGAAIATLTAEWVLAIIIVVPLARRMPELELSVGTVLPALVAGLGGALVLLAPVPVVAQAVAGFALYVGLLFLLRGVPAELTSALIQRRPSRAA